MQAEQINRLNPGRVVLALISLFGLCALILINLRFVPDSTIDPLISIAGGIV